MLQGSRHRAVGVALAALVGVALVATPWRASAAPGIPIPGQTTTTTTAPPEQQPPSTTTTTAKPASTTTTTAPSAPPILGQPTTTTTAPPAAGGDGSGGQPAPSGGDSGPPPPAASPSAGDGGGAPAGAGAFPPELQALMNSVHRTPANNTKALLFALSPLVQLGLTETQAAIVGFGRFPVAGLASYSHDWWFPRFGPGWRLHQGTDIFAAFGTPVRAPVDGTVKIHNGGLGGLSVYVVQPDHTYWYLAHLSAVAEGLQEGATVKTGDVVGFVGDSGNAKGGPMHLHFEIHPGGGGAIDPKAVLDQFISDATALAPKVVEAYANVQPGATPPAVAPLVAPLESAIAPALPPRAALLWTTSVSPTGGAVHLAEAEAARIATSIDWSVRDEDEGASLFQRQMAKRYAAWWMQPLVHPMLQPYLGLD
jgi:murein DD-endopeptidase MepM/ murein hydrolase activator NlpD